MAERLVTLGALGAWVLKGNADAADLHERFALDPRVDSWCVRPGYRADLMDAGQRVVFWASGSRRRLPYGVWAVGVLTGPPEVDTGGRCRVSLDLVVDPPPLRVPRERLRADPRLAGAEVFRQPQAANPSFLTVPQFAALHQHLGERPPPGDRPG